jgi:hypothetical protein
MVKVENPEIKTMLDSLMNNPNVESDTKTGFLHSLLFQFNTKKYLTQNQFVALERIHKNYSVDYSEWHNEFKNSDKSKYFKIAVAYYRQTHYFASVVTKVQKDSGYIPTPDEYRNICENKYAKILIEGYLAPPKYELGQLVRMRSIKHSHHLMGQLGNVIEVLEEVKSATRGNKMYKIYFPQSEQTVILEERNIAKARDKDVEAAASMKVDNY